MKVLITGASSGIGREMAKILAKSYSELVLVARNQTALENLKAEIQKYSDADIKIVSTDLSVSENCIKLYNENKGVDFLINNAGFGDWGKFDETSLEKDLAMISTNVTALHVLTKLYLKDMKEANSGRILNTASIAGFMPGPFMSAYYATKAYVVRLSEGIRQELKKDKSKVKISILCPGPIKTNFEKTANVGFKFNGIDPTRVANYTLKHLNKFYIVPSLWMRMARIVAGIIPASLASKVIYKIQSKKIK